MLETRDLDVFIAGTQILRSVSVDLGKGRTIGLIGRNGAGKTTLMRSVMGLLPVAKGTILLDGQDVTRRPAYGRAPMGIGYMPEDRRLIPEFTGRLPIIANFQSLSRDMLVRIMSVPKNSIYRQYIEIFRAEGVELSIGPRVFEQISEIAIEYKTGARSLRGIFEELMTPVLYVVPDNPDIHRVEISSLFDEPRLLRRGQGPA